MTTDEELQLLGLGGSFSAEEIEATCRRRCQELESKIERAPTLGLKEKYRRNLSSLEEAWEVLSQTREETSSPNFPTLTPEASLGNLPETHLRQETNSVIVEENVESEVAKKRRRCGARS